MSAVKIEAALRAANLEGRPGLVAYITAGFPKLQGWTELLSAVSMEADVVEVGVPFSDPMADGLTIQRSSEIALQNGVSLRWILDSLRTADPAPACPVLLMSYLNPLLAFGLERLPKAAAQAGVSGFIVPDLPLEECDPLRFALESEGLALVQLVTPITPPERVGQLARASRGFLYAVTMTGVTGGQASGDAGSLPAEAAAYLDRCTAVSPVPVMAGFGIRSAAQVSAVGAHADGAIVGSALIEVIDQGGDPAAFLRGLRPG